MIRERGPAEFERAHACRKHDQRDIERELLRWRVAIFFTIVVALIAVAVASRAGAR